MYKKLLQVFVLGVLVFPFISHAALSQYPKDYKSATQTSTNSSKVTDTEIPGCLPWYNFSTTTGKPCHEIPNCAAGDIYSSLTGKRCTSDSLLPAKQQNDNTRVKIAIDPTIKSDGTTAITWNAAGATSCSTNFSSLLLPPTGLLNENLIGVPTITFTCSFKDGVYVGTMNVHLPPPIPSKAKCPGLSFFCPPSV